MLDKLFARDRQAAPAVEADPRARLRLAQQAFQAAQEAADRAEQVAERARVEATRHRASVAAHGNVNAAVAAWNAERLRSGRGPAELPRDLAEARRRLAVSQQELGDAEAALTLLEKEAQERRAVVTQAAAERRRAIAEVMRAETEDLLRQLRETERAAGELRAVLAGYGGSWAMDDLETLKPLPADLIHIAAEPAHALIDRAGTSLQDATAAWAGHRRSLETDADAAPPSIPGAS